MKNSILKISLVFLGMFLFSLTANAQSCCSKKLDNCPKKGTAECPIMNACDKKGKADCPLIQQNQACASADLKSCPLAGTPECPLIKNCPKKGSPDCPYAIKDKATASNNKNVPACCKKKS